MRAIAILGLGQGLGQALGQGVRLALPPRCPGCGAVTSDDHRFCVECWASLRFIGPPWCAACNIPFAHDRGDGAFCADCLKVLPRHSGVRGAVAYGPVAKTLALRLKYARRTAFAETAARLMARHMPSGTEVIVPVPLHRWRIWSRGFNQAALIGSALGGLCGVDVDIQVLVRHRATPVLRGLGGPGRRKAVRAAFGVDPRRIAAIRGRAVVLVDDVHTTGATADACTAVLLRSGAISVTILCWARVLDEARVD